MVKERDVREVGEDVMSVDAIWGLVRDFLDAVREVGYEYWAKILNVSHVKLEEICRGKGRRSLIFNFVEENRNVIERELRDLSENADRAKEAIRDLIYGGMKWSEIARGIMGDDGGNARLKVESFLKRRYVSFDELEVLYSLRDMRKGGEVAGREVDIRFVREFVGSFVEVLLCFELFNEGMVRKEKFADLVLYYLKDLSDRLSVSFKSCLMFFLYFIESLYGGEVKERFLVLLKGVKGREVKRLMEEGEDDVIMIKRVQVYFMIQLRLMKKVWERLERGSLNVEREVEGENVLLNLGVGELLRVGRGLKRIKLK